MQREKEEVKKGRMIGSRDSEAVEVDINIVPNNNQSNHDYHNYFNAQCLVPVRWSWSARQK